MLRSLSSGVSGLENMQLAMDALGNNIANVNTVGYKAQNVSFHTQFNQLLQDGSAPTANRGGTNPEQVGLGVGVASVDTDQSQGSLTTTGKNTDLALSGSGFFMVNSGSTQYYTRDGGFDFDSNGNLVKIANGMLVQGWMASGNPPTVNNSNPVGNINIPSTTAISPQATATVNIGGNLDSNTPVAGTFSQSLTWHDSLGNAHSWNLIWTKSSANTWAASLPASSTDPSINVAGSSITGGPLTFSSSGALTGGVPLTLNLAYNAGTGVTSPQAMNLDVGTVANPTLTQFAAGTASAPISTAVETNENGYGSGSLQNVSVDNAGNINGVFSNGQTRLLAQVAVASFTNPGGLSPIAQNVYAAGNNSGTPQIGAANSGNRGAIQAGALEGSNVDLAQSFANMITVERGFQANSKIITTSDQMLQTLIGLVQ